MPDALEPRPVRQLRAPRMADMVADHLRSRIILGELKDGDELPTESVMREEFPVSRPSLREALRILETEGLIRIRRGKLGGCVVQAPTAESAAYHLGLVLQASRVPLIDLATARQLLEPICVAQAAARRNRKKIVETLERLTDESEPLVGRGAEFTDSMLAFHRALITISGNQTLEILVGTLERVWSQQEQLWAQQAADESKYPDENLQRAAIAAHRRIARRISDGDVEGASRAARTHLDANTMARSAEGQMVVPEGSSRDSHGPGIVRVIEAPRPIRSFRG